MSRRIAFVLRVGRTHYFAGFQRHRPLLTLSYERILTDPRGLGIYVEWSTPWPTPEQEAMGDHPDAPDAAAVAAAGGETPA